MRLSTILAAFAFVAAPALAASSAEIGAAQATPAIAPTMGSNDVAHDDGQPNAYFGQNRGYAAHMDDPHKMANHLRLKQAKRAEIVERALHPRAEGSKPSASPRPLR